MTTTGERLAGPHDFDCEVTFWRQRGIDGEMKPECDCGTDECVREIDAMERVVEVMRECEKRPYVLDTNTGSDTVKLHPAEARSSLAALDALREPQEEKP